MRKIIGGILVICCFALLLSPMAAAKPHEKEKGAQSPEAFALRLMERLYERPDGAVEMALAAEVEAVAQEMGIEWRKSAVQPIIRSVVRDGQRASVEVEVKATWLWGYPGQPSETTEAYNIHQLDLVQVGHTWKVTRNRHLGAPERPDLPPPSLARGSLSSSPRTADAVLDVTCDGITTPCTYNRATAQAYAFQFWSTPNPAFVDFGATEGGDCTNFASQVVFAGGGYPMQEQQSSAGWWYQSKTAYSWPWAFANEQLYWMRHHYGNRLSDENGLPINLMQQREAAKQLRIGDLIYYAWAGKWNPDCGCYERWDDYFDHTAVVTGFDALGYPLVTYRNGAGYPPRKNVHWRLSTRKNTLIYAVQVSASIGQLP